MKLRLKKLKTK